MIFILSLIMSFNLAVGSMCENPILNPSMSGTDIPDTSTLYMRDGTADKFLGFLLSSAATEPVFSGRANEGLKDPVCNSVVKLMKSSELMFHFKPDVMLEQFESMIMYCLEPIANNISASQLANVLQHFSDCNVRSVKHNTLTIEKGLFKGFIEGVYDEIAKKYSTAVAGTLICKTSIKILESETVKIMLPDNTEKTDNIFFRENITIIVDELGDVVGKSCSRKEKVALSNTLSSIILNNENWSLGHNTEILDLFNKALQVKKD